MSTLAPTITTADGVELKTSLRRSLRRDKLRALLLVAPLFLFVVVSFIVPIGDMLLRSVQNDIVADQLSKTAPLLREWQSASGELPEEAVFAAMAADFRVGAEQKTITRLGQRLNYEKSGMSSLFRKTARRIKRVDQGPWQEQLIKIDKKWGQIETWQLIQTFLPRYTPGYYLTALDMKMQPDGSIAAQEDNRRIYISLFWRTILLSCAVTFLTLLLGFPIAYLLATLPLKISNLLMIMVLLPFWTSLLVRTTAWIALLQKEGVINDFLVLVGVIGDDGRLGMIHNATGTLIAMTHILLPFMILPLYSVMKTIPPSYMRAAKSLGASPPLAFIRVYLPNTIPGIGAGGILVFILAIGYYITPELVGGTSGTFISNRIAYHISSSLNWGLAAALGVLLLGLIMALYALYDKIVGINNIKLG